MLLWNEKVIQIHKLHQPHGSPTNVDPPPIQSLHGNLEASTLLAQSVGHRDSTVFQNDLACWLRIPAHLHRQGRER